MRLLRTTHMFTLPAQRETPRRISPDRAYLFPNLRLSPYNREGKTNPYPAAPGTGMLMSILYDIIGDWKMFAPARLHATALLGGATAFTS